MVWLLVQSAPPAPPWSACLSFGRWVSSAGVLGKPGTSSAGDCGSLRRVVAAQRGRCRFGDAGGAVSRPRPTSCVVWIRPMTCALAVVRVGATPFVRSGSVPCAWTGHGAGHGYPGGEIPRVTSGALVSIAPRYAFGRCGASLLVFPWRSWSTRFHRSTGGATGFGVKWLPASAGRRDERQEGIGPSDGVRLPARESLRRVCAGGNSPPRPSRSARVGDDVGDDETQRTPCLAPSCNRLGPCVWSKPSRWGETTWTERDAVDGFAARSALATELWSGHAREVRRRGTRRQSQGRTDLDSSWVRPGAGRAGGEAKVWRRPTGSETDWWAPRWGSVRSSR